MHWRYVGLGPKMFGGTGYPASLAHPGILVSDERPACKRHLCAVTGRGGCGMVA
jgi:hypothetical protein